jgi:hypothetical protein
VQEWRAKADQYSQNGCGQLYAKEFVTPGNSDYISLGVTGAPFQVHVSSANLQSNEQLKLNGGDNNEILIR